MAAYAPQIPEEFFSISYALLVAAVVWSSAAFLVSASLSNYRISTGGGWRIRTLQIAVPILILILGGYLVGKVHAIQVSRELSAFKGILFPSSDIPPHDACDHGSQPRSTVRVHLGSIGVTTDANQLEVMYYKSRALGKIPLLTLTPLPDGTVALSALILARDGRVIVDIDQNTFEVNRNTILDSWSPPRPDRSTILVRDEFGNTLKVKLYKHIVVFQGRLYLPNGGFVQVDENLFRTTANLGVWAGETCFDTKENPYFMEFTK